MKNLLHEHSSEEVRKAAVALCDALSQYERSTGRQYLIILKADGRDGVCEYRSLSGGPASPHQSDQILIEAFAELVGA